MASSLRKSQVSSISKICRIHRITTKISTRTVLSDAYLCSNEWKARLSTKPLLKIKMGEFYTELDKKLTQHGSMDPIDMDLFANNITKEDQLYELEDLIHRFRLTPQTVSILPSTPHATIRSFLQFEESKSLLKILHDKANYGIFPDAFCYNILMDYFIKKNSIEDAVKMATLMMLQEDFGDDISVSLAFYSCYKLIQEKMPGPYVKEEVKEEEVDEDDIEWVRVHFLRADYFDDHFDIENKTLLLGKTMWMLGQERKNALGFTFQLLGLCIYQKWQKLLNLLDTILENQYKVTKDGIEKFQAHLSEVSEIEENTRIEINEKLKSLSSSGLIIDESMDVLINKQLADINETDGARQQIETYKSWNEARENEIKKQVEKFIRLERIKKIEAKKKELKEKEELLFFFENFDKIKKELPALKTNSTTTS